MLTVNITGSATGTALMSSTSVMGRTSTRSLALQQRRHEGHGREASRR